MNKALATEILQDDLLNRVYQKALSILSSGLTAGDRYPEVWIRDMATFLELSCMQGLGCDARKSLRLFFDFQSEAGEIIDGYTGRKESVDSYNYILSGKHPELVGHKNTVETDQESSLVRGVRAYVEATGDLAFLESVVDGNTVLERLAMAIDWVYSNRWSAEYGLAWNGTTIDWGDGQPCRDWQVAEDGSMLMPERLPALVELNEDSNPALCIYTNAMLCLALKDLGWLCEQVGSDASIWLERGQTLRSRIRQHLWDAGRQKFIPHVYLDKGSPFPADFDEAAIYFHGGTTVAIQAGILEASEIKAHLRALEANVKAAGVRTVGITIWPLYDIPELNNYFFEKKFYYQNGGDWPWWGGRLPQGLLQSGFDEDAYRTLRPIAEMIDEAGFYEWHHPDGKPEGAANFRGSAGVVGKAIKMIFGKARETLEQSS